MLRAPHVAPSIPKRKCEGPADYPTFHKKGQNESFRLPAPFLAKVETDRIFPPKAEWMRLLTHRPVRSKINNITVSVTAGARHV